MKEKNTLSETKSKSGLAVLVGRSNVGKSTLLNTLVGTKISATSAKPQMTRHIIHGVLNTFGGQAVFVDTPGIFKDRHNPLTGKLQKKVNEALEDIDVLIYVVDPSKEIGSEERATYALVRKARIPKIMVINKSDLPKNERIHEEDYLRWSKEMDAVFNLSAIRASHIKPLQESVINFLPEGEPLYPEEQITNINKEFWISEIIREKVYSVLEKEIPYNTNVEVENVEEKEGVVVITANILTDKDRYKSMLIGRGAAKIKEIGKLARRELEQAINKKIYLDLNVSIDKHWMDRI